MKQLEEVDVVEKRIVSAKEYAAVPKEIKFSESDIKSSSDEETDYLEDEDAVLGNIKMKETMLLR